MTITSGVPQGSILGPLLFLLYINDIQHCSKIVSFILFADDTTISHSNKCLKTLNEIMQVEINKVAEWLNINKLSINTSKTKFILFRSYNKKQNFDITIEINKEKLKQVKNTTFLGIVIDECLTWNEHVDLIAKKVIKSAGVIAKIRHFTNALKLIYYALVYPYLIYGNIIWGNTYKKRIQKLMNIQKKIVRLMTFNSYLAHSEPIFKDLKILDIYKINDYLISLFMFRYHYSKNLPEVFTDYFVTNDQIHQHNTRNKTQLHKSYKRTNCVKHTLSNKGVDVWNGLECHFKNITSRDTFKNTIKEHFLQISSN